MKTMLTTLFAACAFTAVAVPAAPTVVVDALRQRWPWNGMVDVDYTVSGIERPGDWALTLTVTGTVDGAAVAYTARTFENALPYDLPTHNGSHRITWDAVADGVEVLAADAVARVELVYKPVSGDDADYLVIDLSPGPDAAEYPVRWLKGVGTAAFNIDRYKTTKIVLKRVPKGVFMVGVDYDALVSNEYQLKGRWVELTSDFFFGLFEVTQRQYELVTGTNPSKFKDAPDSPKRPVETVIWHVLRSDDGFIGRLKARAKYAGAALAAFDLPTEAQWERGAHGLAGARSHLDRNQGNDETLSEYAWIPCNADERTHEVGTTLKNQGYGWYDIQGNVGELCLDFSDGWNELPASTKENPDVNPCRQRVDGHGRVVYKGGTWWTTSKDELRMDKRLATPFDSGSFHVGLRLCYTCPSAE